MNVLFLGKWWHHEKVCLTLEYSGIFHLGNISITSRSSHYEAGAPTLPTLFPNPHIPGACSECRRSCIPGIPSWDILLLMSLYSEQRGQETGIPKSSSDKVQCQNKHIGNIFRLG